MFRLACGLYDQLEIFSMRRTKVEISYINSEGDGFNIEGVIVDIVSKNGIESIIVNGDTSIETQNIIMVNSIEFK